MRYVLPIAIELGLLVYCLIDCIQTDEGDCRNLGKSWWVLLIILLPVAGGVAWLVAGRPVSSPRRQVPWPSTQTAGFPEYERPGRAVAPDDDPEFLARLERQRERENRLAEWEAQLRAREAELARGEDAAGGQDQGEPERG